MAGRTTPAVWPSSAKPQNLWGPLTSSQGRLGDFVRRPPWLQLLQRSHYSLLAGSGLTEMHLGQETAGNAPPKVCLRKRLLACPQLQCGLTLELPYVLKTSTTMPEPDSRPTSTVMQCMYSLFRSSEGRLSNCGPSCCKSPKLVPKWAFDSPAL